MIGKSNKHFSDMDLAARSVALAAAATIAAACSADPVTGTRQLALAPTSQLDFQHFLAVQGTFCFDDGAGGCLLFVPPDPNFVGWANRPNADGHELFAGIDYAGLADTGGPPPELSGSVTARERDDGTTEVTATIRARNANAWVIDLDLNGDILGQIAGTGGLGPTLFGHRPRDVKDGASQALADTRFTRVYSLPGHDLTEAELLKDLVDPDLRILTDTFLASGSGTFTAEGGALYDVPEGTPAHLQVTQRGLLDNQHCGADNPPPGLRTCYPVENIELRAVGR